MLKLKKHAGSAACTKTDIILVLNLKIKQKLTLDGNVSCFGAVFSVVMVIDHKKTAVIPGSLKSENK